jgi:aminoglycoside 6'-N-acetyltransferase
VATERLLIRRYRPDDVEPLLDYYADPDVVRHLLHGPWDRAHAEEEVAKRIGETGIRGPGTAWAVVVEREGLVIGDVAIWADDATGRRGEVGWVFHPAHSGQGFATEAVRAVLATAIDRFELHRVVAQMDARNAASARLSERVGMTREGHLRQHHWSAGEWCDTLIYGLLASEVRG